MFEVTGYEYPNVFVRCRRTAETYMFEIGNDGALTPSEARSTKVPPVKRLSRSSAG